MVKESSLNAVSSVVTEQQGVPEKTAGTVKKQAAPAETDLQAKAESEKKPAEPTEAESPMAAETEKKESASCSCAVEARTKAESGGGQAAPAAATETLEPGEILKELSRIGAEIDALNHRILRQSEKIDSMLQLMEKMSEKRSIFRAEKK